MDTIEGGKWLPHQELAWTLVSTAVERVRELENEIGCFFDRNPDGTLHGKAFAGQTFDRTVHKGDLTGIEIINRLMEQVWARPIRRLEEHRAVALVPAKDGAVAGALMIDIRTGQFRFIVARRKKSPAEAGLGGRRTEIGHRKSALERVPHAPLITTKSLRVGADSPEVCSSGHGAGRALDREPRGAGWGR